MYLVLFDVHVLSPIMNAVSRIKYFRQHSFRCLCRLTSSHFDECCIQHVLHLYPKSCIHNYPCISVFQVIFALQQAALDQGVTILGFTPNPGGAPPVMIVGL